MGQVFVAGSINMDVVATADRHPRIGETVAGKQVLFSPSGKGANQAVSAAKLGTPTALTPAPGEPALPLVNDAMGEPDTVVSVPVEKPSPYHWPRTTNSVVGLIAASVAPMDCRFVWYAA